MLAKPFIRGCRGALPRLAAALGGALFCVAACQRGDNAALVIKPSASEDPPFFTDVTADAGIRFTYRNGEEAGHYAILETLGGGVALLDFDQDGKLDVFLTGGGGFEGKQIVGRPCALYRNLGDMKFEDVSAAALADLPSFYTHGCAVADYDRDGWPDLLVTGWGRAALLHNEGDGRGGRKLIDVAPRAGLNETLWSTSAAWGDLDGDGYPDLYVCRYLDWHPGHARQHCLGFDGKRRDICPPADYGPLPHALYRNRGNGVFENVGVAAGLRVGEKSGRGLGVLHCDVNGDRKPDLYVANDMSGNFLYINAAAAAGTLALRECGLAAGVGRDNTGAANGSMGVAVGDYLGTGRPSIWVTNYENELHALYRNECQGENIVFAYSSPAAGIAAFGQTYVGWGTAFLDLDRDGWDDLISANGHPNYFPRSGPKDQLPILLRNKGQGQFKRLPTAGGGYFQTPHHGRGLAAGDLDNDGQPDLVISHLNQPVAVLRGAAPPGTHWAGFELVGRKHRSIAGARVTVEGGARRQSKFVSGGGSYLSADDARVLFGWEAPAGIDRVMVAWPWGEVESWDDVAADRYTRLVEGTGRQGTGR